MSSTDVVVAPTTNKPQNQQHPPQQPRHHYNHSNSTSGNSNNNAGGGGGNNKRKSKHHHDRSGRKRSKSFSGCGGLMLLKRHHLKPVPPTKFLLGGNINDPLNLNSLQDEEINRAMNAVTPKSSPIPTPPRRKGQIEVIIPPNIRDPLNLIGCADDAEYEQQLYSPVKRCRKKRIKKRRTVSACMDLSDIGAGTNHTAEARTPENSTDSAKIPEQNQKPETPEINTSAVKKDLSLELSSRDIKTENSRLATETTTGSSTNNPSVNNNHNGSNNSNNKGKRKLDDSTASCSSGANSNKKFKYSSMMDKIVSPVVPQPGAWHKRNNNLLNAKKNNKHQQLSKPMSEEEMPKFKEKNKQFQYGNYNRYYGYRNAHNEVDHRLRVFSNYRYLFEGKVILDIGCNIGHVTLSVARDFGAKSVTGIDIDPKLITIARKNVQHYVKNSNSPPLATTATTMPFEDGGGGGGGGERAKVAHGTKKSSEFFPIAMPILYGPIDIPGFSDAHSSGEFPNNVQFKCCNYVLENDSLLALEQPQFDVILCLSITKWIHLNWGDDGMKQALRRMYAQLRPGGRLILEPQSWASYKSKRKLTEAIFKNYNSIEFFPDKFTEYLLSSVVGFAKSEILGFPHHQSRGFRRPVQIFTKSTMFLSERIEATPSNITITPSNSADNDVLYQKNTKTEKYVPDSQGEGHIYYTNILNNLNCSGDGGERTEERPMDASPLLCDIDNNSQCLDT